MVGEGRVALTHGKSQSARKKLPGTGVVKRIAAMPINLPECITVGIELGVERRLETDGRICSIFSNLYRYLGLMTTRIALRSSFMESRRQ